MKITMSVRPIHEIRSHSTPATQSGAWLPAARLALRSRSRAAGSGFSFPFVAFSFLLLWTLSTRAADIYSTITNGQNLGYTATTTWVGGVVPGLGDNAWFTNSTASGDYTIDFVDATPAGANAYLNNGPAAAQGLHLGLGTGKQWLITNSLVIGSSLGSTGTVFVQVGSTGGSLLVTNSAGTATLVVGQSGYGSFWMYSGNVIADNLFATNGANSVLRLQSINLTTLHGSTVNANGGDFSIGNSFNAGEVTTWNMMGGTNVISNGGTSIGNGAGTGARGVVTVNGGGSIWSNTGIVYVGKYQGGQMLVISNGASEYNNSAFEIGIFGLVNNSSYTNFNNSVTVTGSNSLLRSADYLRFNAGISNQLTVANGGTAYVGARPTEMGASSGGSNNVILVTGTNSLFQSAAGILVGEVANGNALIITNGGQALLGSSIVGTNGTVTGNQIIVSGGTLNVTNASSSLEVRSGALVLNSGTANLASLVATNGVVSAVNFNGGTLAVRSTTVSNGSAFVVGNGGAATLDLLGGTHSFLNGLQVSSGSTLMVTNGGGTTLNGVITNLGLMTVLNSRAIYQNNVVNLGAYVSDPSTNSFNGNFTVGPTATVTAVAGDVYAFGSNFVMQSTNRAFDMHLAQVVFTGTNAVLGINSGITNHIFNLAGSGALDMGAVGMNATQLATNFSIGALSISLSNNVTFTGTKSGTTTNALYVGWLDLSAWNTNAGVSLTNTLSVALTLPDINLYYDASDTRNAYLQDASYALWGGGGLLIPIPEPSTLVLLLLGPAVVLLRRRTGQAITGA